MNCPSEFTERKHARERIASNTLYSVPPPRRERALVVISPGTNPSRGTRALIYTYIAVRARVKYLHGRGPKV